ncbi:hypothetical protein C9I56_00170 [Paraburkholderia caribensis]|uniref:Uncharacterized protein n=1 Tax=Paraburkholderia caribensis TaxID=75105 RepID=A0A9Q6S644_9BURK|nr:hypothetical protein C9I56_00170 [Paraburkholderia caribensis]QLB65577.1 hypothetical protein A9O66_24695 [Paraburkholderia caribensis]
MNVAAIAPFLDLLARLRLYIQKVVTIVDREHPFLLQYKHGFLESYNFATTLTSDGALSSINTSSNPDHAEHTEHAIT